MSASKVRQIAIAGSFFVISVAVIFFQEADTIREWSNKVYDVLYVLDPFAMYKSWHKTLFGGESLPPRLTAPYYEPSPEYARTWNWVLAGLLFWIAFGVNYFIIEECKLFKQGSSWIGFYSLLVQG
jgi:hypothetical protein